MSKKDALVAYRDSLYDAAQYDIERRAEWRSVPIIGGIWPSLKLLGNAIYRPFKVVGSLMLGYKDTGREFPKMPPVPKEFEDSSLGKAFDESWKLKEEASKARVDGLAKLLDLDISGWWKKSSIASYADAKDTHVVFPEDGIAQQHSAAASHSFTDSISRGSSTPQTGR